MTADCGLCPASFSSSRSATFHRISQLRQHHKRALSSLFGMAYGLCNPEDIIQVPDTVPGTRSHWPKAKDYIPNENDKRFRQWLNGWRRKTSEDTYGKDCASRLGYSNMMLDDTFELICDAAHDNLIASIDDLYEETRWHLTGKYGQTVVDKINEIIPSPLPSKPHPASIPQGRKCPIPSPLPSKPHHAPISKGRKCSNCGQTGHNSERFPKFQHPTVSTFQ